ncbi:hypothetical protein SAMN05421504_101997 [Amycolatopsis xylanica]|uniref:Uncharacterized protein n=1 Tax=Amycolatopsis xylanica TaxID=589385 RepID=A0A1H2UTI1_9PSEU|nr:hypothetical protein [Amycolatopsis xylanica]SDW59421.1 hypothetical protein SAMN05421504_101997 [Amycolatopsis xylanica]
MSDVLHKLVSLVLTGALIGLVGWLSVTVRKKKVAKAEAAAPAPVEDRSQALLRQAQQFDRSRDEMAAQGRLAEAMTHAHAAAQHWHELTQARPGRFQAEERAALKRLSELETAGHA